LVDDDDHRFGLVAALGLDEKSHEKVMGLLRAGDPRGEVTACYNAKEAVRELYGVKDHELAGVFIDELIRDMNDPSWPVKDFFAYTKSQACFGIGVGWIAVSPNLKFDRHAFMCRSRTYSWLCGMGNAMDTACTKHRDGGPLGAVPTSE
jgi:hypothetical protein